MCGLYIVNLRFRNSPGDFKYWSDRFVGGSLMTWDKRVSDGGVSIQYSQASIPQRKSWKIEPRYKIVACCFLATFVMYAERVSDDLEQMITTSMGHGLCMHVWAMRIQS